MIPFRHYLQRFIVFAGSRLGMGLGAAFVIYTLLGFFAAPALIRDQLPKQVAQHLNARASVEAVRVNPLLFRLELQGLKITEPGGAPVLDLGRFLIDFELSSLLRFGWTFREIRFDKPVIHAALDAGHRLNFSRLLKPAPEGADAGKAGGKPPRLLIQHLAIAGGVLRFSDHSLQPAAQAQIDPVNFEIHDLSTIPDVDGNLKLAAKLPDGASLLWEGMVSLSPIESNARFSLRNLKLATPWKFVRDHLTIAEPGGDFSIDLRYSAGYAGGKVDLRVSELALALKDLQIRSGQGGEPLARLSTVALEGGSFDLEKRALTLDHFRVAGGTLNIQLDEDSNPDWARLLRQPAGEDTTAKKSRAVKTKSGKNRKAAKKPEPAAAPAGQPWTVTLPAVSIKEVALGLTDFSRAKPLRLSAADLSVSLAAQLLAGDTLQAVVRDGAFALKDITVTAVEEKDSPVTLRSAEISGFALDLQQQTIGIALARLAGGQTWVRRSAEGELQLVSMFAPRKVKTLEALHEDGFSFTVDRAEIAGYSIALSDQSFQPPVAYDIEQLNAAVSKISIPAKGPSPLEASLRIRQGGSVKARGQLDLRKSGADLRVEAAGISLKPLDAALKRDTTLTLLSGSASASGRVVVDGQAEPPALRYSGSAGLADIDLQTGQPAERLFSLKRITASDIDFDSREGRLGVAHVGVQQPYAKLLINKDKTTNLAAVRRPATTPVATAPAAAASPAGQTEAATAKPLAVNIERVSVEQGSMDFADLSLVLPFATFIKDLNGSASGLSSSPDSRASLKFEGGIADYGLARAEGTLQPFAPKKFTDIAVAFRNVELMPMSPYTATFAGRKIASGKLSLDLQYKIDNSRLAGDNKLLLDRFTLGERVESPTAVNLPLDLAIALLTDSDGKIDLALPVSGDIDNPEFSYGHVIWQAIRTVLTRIVTAPFRALGALFGGNAETLGDIVFDAGSARLLPTEVEKLKRVAEGLQKRPQLKLQVQGTFHKDADGKALRTRAVRADLAAREGTRLAAGEDPGPVGFDNAKTQRALENMLEARAGGNAVAQFTDEFRKSAGRDVSRVNAALALVGRGAGDRNLYVAMHQRLVELQPLPPAALAELAKTRAEAITAALTKEVKFDPARLSGKPADAVGETDKNGVPSKLSFEPLK